MEGFSYSYSAPDHQEVQRIRSKYLPREQTPMEQLRELDAQVRRPVEVFSYVYGAVGTMIMGAGMSLVMTTMGDSLGIAQPIPCGVVIGIVGMLMALTTYKIYTKILEKRKKKYADEILQLSEKIMRG